MSNQSKSELRKLSILKAAEKVFAAKGHHEATVSEIAREAGVSEGTIYEYFSSKEGLLFHIPEAVTRELGEVGRFHVGLIRGSANRLRAIVYLYLNTWQENPDYAVINLIILRGNLKFRETEGYRLIREGFRMITGLIEEGMASGEFRSDINPYIIRSILMGTVDHVTTNWLVSDRKRNLLDTVDPILDVVMEGILHRDETQAGAPRLHWSQWQKQKATASGQNKGE